MLCEWRTPVGQLENRCAEVFLSEHIGMQEQRNTACSSAWSPPWTHSTCHTDAAWHFLFMHIYSQPWYLAVRPAP
eukprot:1156746-Pelagomonas_calceolata.AAC.4